ncbi:MAG TPA: organomercurial lyase [Terriglobales bacterium]|nr:organomercurial lyase [Terriglobales bacterium]
MQRLSETQFDQRLRLFVYRHILRKQVTPSAAEMAKAFSCPLKQVRASLERLSQSHAFMLQEDGELWRVAPFSAIPTPFPVRIGRRSWFGNCIWDALGIPAMLGRDASIDAACACCNYQMPIEVRGGKLRSGTGVIHIAVPARDWYKDVVFT